MRDHHELLDPGFSWRSVFMLYFARAGSNGSVLRLVFASADTSSVDDAEIELISHGQDSYNKTAEGQSFVEAPVLWLTRVFRVAMGMVCSHVVEDLVAR